MHVVVGLLCLAGTAILLAEFFVVFLLPRRVKRDPRIVRGLLRSLWIPWRAVGRRLPKAAADTMLGIYGPFGLLTILGLLSAGVILCFSGMQWAVSSHFGGTNPAGYGHDLYFSAAAFFSASTISGQISSWRRRYSSSWPASSFITKRMARITSTRPARNQTTWTAR